MNKEDFILVLQASLLAFDGVSVQELCEKYGFPKNMAVAGINLTKYLRSVNLGESAK